ncbi:MAG: hypothetical protein ACP5XB_09155 [Isosphaeraceae bacterium]
MPTTLGKSTDRLRFPKVGLPDATAMSCQGNLTTGVYDVVVRSGDNGAPSSQVSLRVTMSGWKLLG